MAFGIIRELVTRLGFQIDDAEARRYEARIKRLGKSIRGFGRTMSLFVTAPIVALGGSFIKAAADAEEAESKFKEVFQGINDEADTMAKALSKDFDLANVTAQEMLSTTGGLLVQFGFTTEAALEMANQVSALSVDIASFENVQGGAARASQAITKALLGENEMLKGINKVVRQEDITKKIAILRSEGMTFATKNQAKAVATLALVTDQSERAIGDYARTQGSATNQTRRLIQKWKELSITLGKVLLPLYTDLVKVLSDVVEWINSFSPAGRKAIVIIAGITAALGPLLIVLGSIVTILVAIPVLALAAVAAVGALAFLIGEDIAAFFQGRQSVVGLLLTIGKQLIKDIFKFLSDEFAKWVKENITTLPAKIKAAAAAAVGIGGGPRERAAAITDLGSVLGGVFPFAGAAAAMSREVLATDNSQSNVTLHTTIVQAPGESPSAIAREVNAELTRMFNEALSLGATVPRTAP